LDVDLALAPRSEDLLWRRLLRYIAGIDRGEQGIDFRLIQHVRQSIRPPSRQASSFLAG
jgi:hypothetical protein